MTWGATNNENDANYGGVSAINLKKPEQQKVGVGRVADGWRASDGSGF